MINNVVLVGRLTKTPELRYTASNIAVCQFTLAVNRSFVKEGQQEVDFIQCVVWRAGAENLSKYQDKGSLIGVEGTIQTRTYDNDEGKKVYITEILVNNIKFLEFKKKEGNEENSVYDKIGDNSSDIPKVNNEDFNPFKTTIDIDINDDLPF